MVDVAMKMMTIIVLAVLFSWNKISIVMNVSEINRMIESDKYVPEIRSV